MANGEAPKWAPAVWEDIRNATRQEVDRACVARKFLPLLSPAGGETDITTDWFDATTGRVLQGITDPIFEIFSEFFLTKQQVDREETYREARTAAISRARDLAQVEDLLIFQGPGVVPAAVPAPPPAPGLAAAPPPPAPQIGGWPTSVAIRDGNVRFGLLTNPGILAQSVQQLPKGARVDGIPIYGANTDAAVETGIQQLYKSGHFGPYALVLHPVLLADTKTPLPNTLIKPADRIAPKVEFFGSTRTLKAKEGVIVSLGGNSMDLVMRSEGYEIDFVQVNPQGLYSFRVSHRFTFRTKRQAVVVRLNFA